jgi:hypothetical protein
VRQCPHREAAKISYPAVGRRVTSGAVSPEQAFVILVRPDLSGFSVANVVALAVRHGLEA